MSILLDSEAFTVPSGDGKSLPKVFDMRRIYKADARLSELATMNQMKAGELASTFIEAWGTASEYHAKIVYQFTVAKQRVRTTKAIVVLDKSKDILKAKGLIKDSAPAGSEGLRDAVVDMDVDYNEAVQLLSQLEACCTMMEIKAERFKMAYFTVNKLMSGQERSKDVSGGAGDDDVGAYSDTERAEEFARENAAPEEPYRRGFGSPKY